MSTNISPDLKPVALIAGPTASGKSALAIELAERIGGVVVNADASQVYRDRSPLFAADSIRDPVIIFQGTEDEVVDKSQSDAIVESLKRRNVPHEYHVYEGEGHGWRKPQTIEHYITAVESFLKEHVLYA